VRENLRSEDLFGRFGGDEFLIGCADLDRDQALALAENIRTAAHQRARTEDPRLAALSLSLGIAHADPGAGYSLELLFSRADAALYAAKRGGRNRSVLEAPGTPAPPRDQHAPRSLAPTP
jgi:diguanylate cyclase (GGDEF)-like protein